MEQAAITWSTELTRAGNDLSLAAHSIEKEFRDLSLTSEKGKDIPNPVKLLRRICALETSIQRLRNECVGLSQTRNDLILAVTQTQHENLAILRQLSRRAEGSRHKSSPSHREWEKLAEQVEEQRNLFLEANQIREKA